MCQCGEQIISCCGYVCSNCDQHLLPTDPAVQAKMIPFYKKMGWLKEDEGLAEAIERGMYCLHCRGDRSKHWSADCEILHCCVDVKHLQYCSECDEFVCERLQKWAGNDPRPNEALARLKAMRDAAQHADPTA